MDARMVVDMWNRIRVRVVIGENLASPEQDTQKR
jgi:hypothetical protein